MDELEAVLKSRGASLVGFADLSPVAESIREGMPYAVSVAVGLSPLVISEITEGPTMKYYEDYNRVNTLLAELGNAAARFLRDKGFRAHVVVPTTEGYDRETNSVPFQHKTAATRAGLGWIGKCALLVTREYGSAIRLMTVLTNAALGVGKATEVSACGECSVCVERCPAGAPSGREWAAGIHRDEFFDATLCGNTARELSARIGLNKTICGICIVACPWTKRYLEKNRSFRK